MPIETELEGASQGPTCVTKTYHSSVSSTDGGPDSSSDHGNNEGGSYSGGSQLSSFIDRLAGKIRGSCSDGDRIRDSDGWLYQR